MLYEVDTLFDCTVTATIYDKSHSIIASKELQDWYSSLYRGSSKDELIQNIIDSYKYFLELNSIKNGLNRTENFFGVDNWNSLDINVTLLNNPRVYENEDDAEKMHFMVKRAYRFCEKYYDMDVYTSYFKVYTNSYVYKVEMDDSIYLKVEKIIQNAFPYFSHITYVDYPQDVVSVINDFDGWINKGKN